jgi:endonuclease YncB( thermonuclease family)
MGARSRARSTRRIIRLGLVALLLTLGLSASTAVTAPPVYRIDHVSDGDTVALRNRLRVRLVQIDTPEVSSAASVTGGRRRYGRRPCFWPARECAFSRSRRPTASTSTGGCCATSSAYVTASM